MLYINGVPFFGSLHIDGLVDIDQTYNPASENPQSGIAVAEALSSAGAVLLPAEELSYDDVKAYIDSGKEIVLYKEFSGETFYYRLEHSFNEYVYTFAGNIGDYYSKAEFHTGATAPNITEPKTLLSIDDVVSECNAYDPNPVNGAAVKKAIAGIQVVAPLKMYWEMQEIPESGTLSISIPCDDSKKYTVCGVFVTTMSGEMLMCDVHVYDYTCSGSSGMCNITLSFVDPPPEIVSLRILYMEEDG